MLYILNGPPKSGKDTAATFIDVHKNAAHLKFAGPLKEGLKTLLMEDCEAWYRITETGLKNQKFAPIFQNFTPRECLIDLSESFMKGHFGEDIFGRLMIKQIKRLKKGCNVVISDCGFDLEVLPVVEWIGPENCHILKLLRS
jgi:hypothetical protein